MYSVRRKVVGCALAACVGLVPALIPVETLANDIERTEEPTAGEMMFDGVVVRPLMLGGTIIGAAIFVATLPFSIPAGGVSGAGRKLIAEPAGYTFTRPFGDFQERE